MVKHKAKRKAHKHKKEYFGLMLLGAGILLYLGRDQIKASVCGLNNNFSFCQAEAGFGPALGDPGDVTTKGIKGWALSPVGAERGGGCTNTQIVQGTCSPAKRQ